MKCLKDAQTYEEVAQNLLSYCFKWSNNTQSIKDAMSSIETQIICEAYTYDLAKDRDNKTWTSIM